MSFGIKISKPTYGATASPENLYVDSDTPLLKVAMEGAGSIVFTGGDGSGTERHGTVTHNLGYTPVVQVYSERAPGSRRKITLGSYAYKVGTDYVSATLNIGTSNLVLNMKSGTSSPAGTYNYYYYVFYDEV